MKVLPNLIFAFHKNLGVLSEFIPYCFIDLKLKEGETLISYRGFPFIGFEAGIKTIKRGIDQFT